MRLVGYTISNEKYVNWREGPSVKGLYTLARGQIGRRCRIKRKWWNTLQGMPIPGCKRVGYPADWAVCL